MLWLKFDKRWLKNDRFILMIMLKITCGKEAGWMLKIFERRLSGIQSN